jgi:MarR family
MSNTGIPRAVEAFLLKYIDSIPELESLLLVRAEPAMVWQPATLAARLHVDVQAATTVLNALERRGLLSRREAGFIYAPKSGELDAAIEALTGAYRRLLIPITSIVHAKTQT